MAPGDLKGSEAATRSQVVDKRPAELPSLFDDIAQSISFVENQLDVLESKLSPVLRNEPSPDNDFAQRSTSTHLGEYLSGLNARLQRVNARLGTLNDKTEL